MTVSTTSLWVGLVAAFLTAISAVIVAIKTQQGARAAAAETARAAPYEALAKRVETLEDKVDRLERRENLLVEYTRRLLAWIANWLSGHGDGPPPQPPQEFVDQIPFPHIPWEPSGDGPKDVTFDSRPGGSGHGHDDQR